MLQEKGFDYIALGHIHKTNYSLDSNQKIIYPGSTLGLGFDELGEHGMIVGTIEKSNIKLEFKPLDKGKFKDIQIDVSNIISKEELIEQINNLENEDTKYIKIILNRK